MKPSVDSSSRINAAIKGLWTRRHQTQKTEPEPEAPPELEPNSVQDSDIDEHTYTRELQTPEETRLSMTEESLTSLRLGDSTELENVYSEELSESSDFSVHGTAKGLTCSTRASFLSDPPTGTPVRDLTPEEVSHHKSPSNQGNSELDKGIGQIKVLHSCQGIMGSHPKVTVDLDAAHRNTQGPPAWLREIVCPTLVRGEPAQQTSSLHQVSPVSNR